MYWIKNLFYSFSVFIIGSYLISHEIWPITWSWIIEHPANAWSSMCYAFPIAPLSIKIPLLTLSIASFGLWSNQIHERIINFVDVTCVLWVIVVVSLSVLPRSRYKWKVIYIVDACFVIYMALAIAHNDYEYLLTYYDENLVPVVGIILTISTAMVGSFYMTHTYFLVGGGAIMTGFACKIVTIYYGHYWGTSVFHTLTALGIACVLECKERKEPTV